MNKNKKWIMSGAALFGAGILIWASLKTPVQNKENMI